MQYNFFTGYGIHIFTGTFGASGPAAGSLPNNALVIATNTNNDNRLRVFCRSDSMTANVGEFIGLDGTAISNNSFFLIERSQPGEITLVNRHPDQSTITSNEQGVYTCRIPDSTNTMRDVNIGIYVTGYNSEFTTLLCYFMYSAPSLESRFLGKLLYPLHGLELRSQKWIICTYICLLQCGEGFNLISENLRILWLPQGT